MQPLKQFVVMFKALIWAGLITMVTADPLMSVRCFFGDHVFLIGWRPSGISEADGIMGYVSHLWHVPSENQLGLSKLTSVCVCVCVCVVS